MSSDPHVPLEQTTASDEIVDALKDGGNLLETIEPSKQIHRDLKSVLESRLSRYYVSRNQEWSQGSLELRDLELLTAREALSVVERIQRLLAIEDDAVAPTIGTRDLSQTRKLLSVVFKWGMEPLLGRVKEAWPSTPSNGRSEVLDSPSRIADLTGIPDDYKLLSEITLRMLGLLFPNGGHGKLAQTLITTTLLNRHLTDILQPAFALGWLPKPLSAKSMPVVDELRPLAMRLLSILPASQTISSLGSIISSSPPPVMHIFRTCTTLLSRQLLRPDGIQGLFAAVYGEEETTGEGVAAEKLERVSTVLNAVPTNTKPQDYFEHVIPRIIALLSERSPSTFRRAAAFTISRMFSADDAPAFRSIKVNIISGLLHHPFLHVDSVDSDKQIFHGLEELPAATKAFLRPDVAFDALLTLLSNADPSPTFISDLLSPVIPPLYSLLHHLDKVRTSDPRIRDALRGMLLTWGKIVAPSEGVEILGSIVRDGQEYGWKVDLEGRIHLLPKPEQLPSLTLLRPGEVPEIMDLEDPDFDANIFNLYPDPLHLVKLIQGMDRGDISSSLFLKVLENYRNEKTHSRGDSLRILLYLQIIMQMQNRLLEGTTSNILQKPQEILSFIHHVLGSANSSSSVETSQLKQPTLEEKFKFMPDGFRDSERIEEGDSDDDMPDSEVIQPDDELVETSINLLLSVLEADENLSARTMPILNDIFSLLEPLSRDGSSTIKPLARETRLVLTARLASTSHSRVSGRKSTEEEESVKEIYQKALKLLQDPILPVRAHGLLLLRQLVTPSVTKREQGIQTLDSALAPAILGIFLQSVQDEDSYIFLHSVQGLAAMVDGFGREVLKGLMNEYAGRLEGLGASVVTEHEVDVRTRVGEALGIVIKRCGEALGVYIDILIPPLFKLVRTREIPTVLRTSAISLLADCVNTYPFAVLIYMEDLAATMLDLLQIESVPVQPQLTRQKKSREPVGDMEKPGKEVHGNEKESAEFNMSNEADGTAGRSVKPETMDDTPTSMNGKLPPLRRAALHFFGLLVREATRHTHEHPSGDVFISQALISRTAVTLGYIAATDEDAVVRVMAREVREGLQSLQKARLGL